jgi:hypothetical protein
MVPDMPTGRIDPRYGDPSSHRTTVGGHRSLLTNAQLYWIITVRADRRPHAVPLERVCATGRSLLHRC